MEENKPSLYSKVKRSIFKTPEEKEAAQEEKLRAEEERYKREEDKYRKMEEMELRRANIAKMRERTDKLVQERRKHTFAGKIVHGAIGIGKELSQGSSQMMSQEGHPLFSTPKKKKKSEPSSGFGGPGIRW